VQSTLFLEQQTDGSKGNKFSYHLLLYY